MRIIETLLYAWQVSPLHERRWTRKNLVRFCSPHRHISGAAEALEALLKMFNLPIRGITTVLSTTSSVVSVDSGFGRD